MIVFFVDFVFRFPEKSFMHNYLAEQFSELSDDGSSATLYFHCGHTNKKDSHKKKYGSED